MSARSLLRWLRAAGEAALLLGLASGPALAQVVVTPQASSLLAGQTCAFRAHSGAVAHEPAEAWAWSILDGGVGAIDAVTGRYAAPPVAEPCTVRIQATYRPRPELRGQAQLLVLPWEPFALVGQVLGAEWLEPFSTDLPFENPATGQPHRPVDRVVPWDPSWRPILPVHCAAYGLPCTLRWTPQPGAQAQLLTYQEGQQLIQKDVTGLNALVITPTGPVGSFSVEALRQVPGSVDTWQSHTQRALIHFRGVVPLAGNVLMEPGHEDGQGLSARFQAPFGLAQVEAVREGYGRPGYLLVSEPQTQVIRKVSSRGEVTTPWGVPGEAGHRDTSSSFMRSLTKLFCPRAPGEPEAETALFNRPTFLMTARTSRRHYWRRTWQCLVADSGNHCLRVLHTDGAVTTLAGVPGQAGYRDALEGGRALFNNPQGLAEDAEGNVYVADQGNGVLRMLTSSGQVLTLAGSPGEPGSRDAVGPAAQFTDLRGLACCGGAFQAEALYAADGHAIRRISLPEGEVTTSLGVVGTAGCAEVQGGSDQELGEALRQPCLNRPCGLLASFVGLEIADTGNHSVRSWHFDRNTLVTVVGEAGPAQTRWGLLRDGLEVPLDERYATLASPTTLASSRNYPNTWLVATGCCLAEIFPGLDLQDRLPRVRLECPPADLAQACAIRFTAEARTRAGTICQRPFRYTVDFLEPDGSLADRVRGLATTSTPVSAQGVFSQRGSGSVVVRCVTDQGVSAGARSEVEVR